MAQLSSKVNILSQTKGERWCHEVNWLAQPVLQPPSGTTTRHQGHQIPRDKPWHDAHARSPAFSSPDVVNIRCCPRGSSKILHQPPLNLTEKLNPIPPALHSIVSFSLSTHKCVRRGSRNRAASLLLELLCSPKLLSYKDCEKQQASLRFEPQRVLLTTALSYRASSSSNTSTDRQLSLSQIFRHFLFTLASTRVWVTDIRDETHDKYFCAVQWDNSFHLKFDKGRSGWY